MRGQGSGGEEGREEGREGGGGEGRGGGDDSEQGKESFHPFSPPQPGVVGNQVPSGVQVAVVTPSLGLLPLLHCTLMEVPCVALTVVLYR